MDGILQSVLVGKAREVYSPMSVEQSSQYDSIKQAVLKPYEFAPGLTARIFGIAINQTNRCTQNLQWIRQSCLIIGVLQKK